MNGTERGFADVAKVLGMTDTESVLKIIDKFGLDHINTLCKLDSAYLGFKDGVPFAVANSNWGNTLKVINKENALVIASSFPFEKDVYEPITFPFSWEEGQQMKLKPYRNYVKIYDDSKKEIRVLCHSYENDSWYNVGLDDF
jgi:hypothetical protein